MVYKERDGIFYNMGLITCIVILKHEKALDNLHDIILKVSGQDFEDIDSMIAKFVRSYNQTQMSHGDQKIYDWFIADRNDMAEMDTQVYSYASVQEEDE